MLARIGRSLSVTASLASVAALGCALAAPAASATPAVAVASAASAASGASAASAASAPALSVPAARVALPAQVDAQPGYQPQNSCDPVARPGTSALGELLAADYGGGAIGYARSCVRGTTEHSDGRALDWMLDAHDPADLAIADRALGWMLANDAEVARRLGVQYIIWNGKIWRAYRASSGWAPYSGWSPHTDHIHISLTWDGAMKRTSWWTGKAITTPDVGTCRVYNGEFAPVYTGANHKRCGGTAPAPVSGKPTYVLGQRSDDIAHAQAKLGVGTDGSFGPITRAAVFGYQEANGLPRTGVLDQATWVALLAA